MRVYRRFLLLGILLRLLFVLIPGKAIQPAWSGGGDAQAYMTLAENLLHGRGYTYSGQPTALRPPLYPLLVAGCMAVAGRLWPVALRLTQFLLGLGTVFLGAKGATKLWGAAVGRVATLLLLYCPTLVYPTSTVSTEALGAFLVAAIFYLATGNLEEDRCPTLAGISIGLAALVRQVAPVLGVPFVVLYGRRRSFRPLLILVVASAIAVSPWVARNYRVFGRPTLSTYGGYNLVRGLVEPQGRSQAGEADHVRMILPWDISTYERNNRARHYPPETAMDVAARGAWLRLVRADPAGFFEIFPAKLSWFWLSTDIVFHGSGFRQALQFGRAAMVFVWWGYLLLAAAALVCLRRVGQVRVFWLFLGWLVLITAVHLPFCMNTRLRIPLVDLPVSVLAAYWLAETKLARRLLGSETGSP